MNRDTFTSATSQTLATSATPPSPYGEEGVVSLCQGGNPTPPNRDTLRHLSATPSKVSLAPSEVIALRDAGALFVVSHSGGKDSQAQMILVRALVPDAQIVVVYAALEGVVWDGTVDHIKATTEGLPFIISKPAKTFFEMVDHRGMFPSPANRQCTSDLKRGPIEREVRRYLKDHPQFGGRVVMCMGMRAEESTGRAKLVPFKRNEGNSKAGRSWFDWLPIHDLLEGDVFAAIAAAAQAPHWAYAAGMTRLSCCFCIMASQADLTTAARLNPTLYAKYVAKERELGFTLSMSRKPLPEITGIA